MGQRLAAVFTCVVTMVVPVVGGEGKASTDSLRIALEYFQHQNPSTIDDFLTRLRPSPIDVPQRTAIMTALPAHGEIRPGAADLTKMSLAHEVLAYHRRLGVIPIKIIDVAPAFVELHERAVILVSANALRLVNNEEFAALIAHELGHEYVWTEYQSALQRGDHHAIQVLELRCDGIAVLTLRHFGVSADHLIRAAEMLTWYNQERKLDGNWRNYASREDRRAFIRAIATLQWTVADATRPAIVPHTVFMARVLAPQSPENVTSRVLAYFDDLSKEQHLDEYLKLARPTPVSMRYKAAALVNLPPNGNVQLSAKSQAKLAALAPIIEFFDRRGIIEPEVIGDNETTFIGLYERCALIITQKALDLLSKQEIQAVAAHELAHEWYWDEYRLARESNQDDKVQEIELRCDGIAILVLVRLRLNPSPMMSALRKMGHYDKDTWGAKYYPGLDERLTFARSMINWISTFPRFR